MTASDNFPKFRMIVMESEKMDIGYSDTTHLGFHYLLHRFFFFWPENVPLIKIQNLDDFLFFVFFTFTPDFTR